MPADGTRVTDLDGGHHVAHDELLEASSNHLDLG
jgi:hypothetical protein